MTREQKLFQRLRNALDPMSAVNVSGGHGRPYLELIDELEERFESNQRELQGLLDREKHHESAAQVQLEVLQRKAEVARIQGLTPEDAKRYFEQRDEWADRADAAERERDRLLEQLEATLRVVAAARHLATVQFTEQLTDPENWSPLNDALRLAEALSTKEEGLPGARYTCWRRLPTLQEDGARYWIGARGTLKEAEALRDEVCGEDGFFDKTDFEICYEKRVS